MGDAICWEALLVAVPHGEDLTVVSADRDYASALNEGAVDQFLADEWTKKKGASVSIHRSLSALFKAHYPDIELAAELEKELAIDALIGSQNFRGTHVAIAKLNSFGDFTGDQVKAMVEAVELNSQISQISQIMEDPDIRGFYGQLLDQHATDLSDEAADRLRSRLAALDLPDFDVSPF